MKFYEWSDSSRTVAEWLDGEELIRELAAELERLIKHLREETWSSSSPNG